MTRLDDVFPRRRNETALTRGWGVRSRHAAADFARPDGAQPQRGSARVPRGPAIPVPFFWSKSLMSSAALLGAPAGPSARSTWNGVAPQRGRPWGTSSGESRLERQDKGGRDTTGSRGAEREGA